MKHVRDGLQREAAVRRLSGIAQFFFRDRRLFLRYISAGAIAAVIEFLLFSALYQQAGWPLLSANGTAFAVALVACFAMQKNWTFRIQGEAGRRLRLYVFMQAVSGVLNTLLMLGLIQGLELYPPLAKVLQIGLVFIWNFSFCRLVVFAQRA